MFKLLKTDFMTPASYKLKNSDLLWIVCECKSRLIYSFEGISGIDLEIHDLRNTFQKAVCLLAAKFFIIFCNW